MKVALGCFLFLNSNALFKKAPKGIKRLQWIKFAGKRVL